MERSGWGTVSRSLLKARSQESRTRDVRLQQLCRPPKPGVSTVPFPQEAGPGEPPRKGASWARGTVFPHFHEQPVEKALPCAALRPGPHSREQIGQDPRSGLTPTVSRLRWHRRQAAVTHTSSHQLPAPTATPIHSQHAGHTCCRAQPLSVLEQCGEVLPRGQRGAGFNV